MRHGTHMNAPSTLPPPVQIDMSESCRIQMKHATHTNGSLTLNLLPHHTNRSLTLPPPPTTYEWVINTRTPSHTNPQKISHSNPIHLNLQPKIAGTKKEEKGRVVGNTSQPSTKNRRDKKGREHYYTPARIEHYYTPARIQRRAIYKKRSFT